MVGIGMNFAAVPDYDADIELTLVRASQVGMDDGDLRVLSVLTRSSGCTTSTSIRAGSLSR